MGAWLFVPSGRRHWYVGYSAPGTPEDRFSTGLRAYGKDGKPTNRRPAEAIRAKTEVALAEGRFLDRKHASRWTLGALGKVYLARLGALKPRSAAWRRDRWRQIERRLNPDLPIEEIAPGTLDDYFRRRLEEGSSRETAKEDLAVLRHALRQAWLWREETGLSEYRLADWKAPAFGGKAPRKPDPIGAHEWKAVLAIARLRAATGEPRHIHGLALLLILRATGARLGEIMRLRRDAVDLPRGIIRREVLKTKSPKEIETRLRGEPLKALRRVMALHEHPLVFPNTRTGAGRRNMRKWWEALTRDAKVKAGVHSIRHAYARDFLAAGGSLVELKDRLGHSSVETTMKYAHLVKRRKLHEGIPTG